MKKKHAKLGGARPGAGKKPGVMGVKVVKTIAVSKDIAAYMETLKKTPEAPNALSASAVLEQLVRKSPAFKKWSEGNRNG